MTTMRWRAPTRKDAPAALALITARDIADFGAPDYTLEDLREEWQGAELDLAVDTVVVEDAEDSGRLVGYAIVRLAESLVVVAPDREGRGLGRGLLGWAERREAERGRDRQRIAAGNDRARELLRAAGYRPQPAIGERGPPSQCSSARPALLSGLAPRAIDGIAVQAGGADALVRRRGLLVAAPSAGLDDEGAIGSGWGLHGLFEEPVEEHASGA